MLSSWPARIVGHVGQLAVVQVPGGLLVAQDPHGWLIDDSETEVRLTDPTHAQAGVVFLNTYQARQVGPALLLTDTAGFVTPLLVPPLQELPASFTLSIPVRAVAQVDPDEAKPFGLPQPECCPDVDPHHVHSMIPPCCPDVDLTAIDELFAGARAPLTDLLSGPAPADPFAFIATALDGLQNPAAAGPFITNTSMEQLLVPTGAADPLAFLSNPE